MIKISFESIDTSMCQILGKKSTLIIPLASQFVNLYTARLYKILIFTFHRLNSRALRCVFVHFYKFKTSSSVHVYTNQDAAILLCSRHNKVTRFQISDNNYWKNETGRWSSVVVDFGLPLRQFWLYIYLTVTCRF